MATSLTVNKIENGFLVQNNTGWDEESPKITFCADLDTVRTELDARFSAPARNIPDDTGAL